QGPRFFSLSHGLAALVGLVSAVGIGAGIFGAVLGTSRDFAGLIAVVALVGAGQALSLETDDGTISVAAVGSLAAASLFGLRAALAVAFTTAVVEWSARRQRVHQVLFNIGALVLASLGSVGVLSLASHALGRWQDLITGTPAACSSSPSRSAATSVFRRRSSTCSVTPRSSTTSASWRSRMRSCSSRRA